MTFTIVRNPRTTAYDVHAAGCAHTNRFDPSDISPVQPQGESGKAVAAQFAAENEGIRTSVKPCAR